MAKKKRPADDGNDSLQPLIESLPDRRVMEQMLRQLTSGFEGKRAKQTSLDRAQEVMYQAFEAASIDEQVRLAEKALKISSDCADAYVLLAEYAKTIEEATDLYEKGVAAGERAIGKKAFKEYEGHFWGFLETRPYMRACEGLAQCLLESGRQEEAADQYRNMLRLNPNDNQGIRYLLVTLLLELEQHKEVCRLLKQYEKDDSAEWVYARVLLAFRTEGESANAVTLLKRAVKANKHVPQYLVGNKPLPHEMPPYIGRGDEDEAVAYVANNRTVWLDTPGAVSWIRKTLKLPMVRGERSRRSSWPQVKLALRGIPQERGEVWQVDVLQQNEHDSEDATTWAAMIVSRTAQEILGVDFFAVEPKTGELLDYLTDIMRRPLNAEPHRPAAVEVRRKAFQMAWKAKLKQIGIECLFSETLDAIDQVRTSLSSAMARMDKKPTAINAEDIANLPIEFGEVWQVGVRPMPAWIMDEGEPYRAWLSLVIRGTDGAVLGYSVVQKRPNADDVWQAVCQAIQHPAIGEPHRPNAIEILAIEQSETLQTHLDQAGIECHSMERLDHVDAAYDSLSQQMAGEHSPPSLLASPGVTLKQAGSFYAAADDFCRHKPWRRVPGDTIIKVECGKFQSGPWYAVVMGQSGVQQGLALYEDLAALQRLIQSDASEEVNARDMSALSLMFSEPFDLATRDVDAAEKYDWPVASPEAYPLFVCINPGCVMRSPLVWELELMEGCLRTIPEFLSTKKPSLSKTAIIASGELNLQLSWGPR